MRCPQFTGFFWGSNLYMALLKVTSMLTDRAFRWLKSCGDFWICLISTHAMILSVNNGNHGHVLPPEKLT